jgi:hypothetical protein
VAAKRTGLSKKLRFEVFKRDSFRCQYCGAAAPEVLLVVDHINPVAKGGKNNILNLITACEGCNAGKGARELSDHSVVEKQRDQLAALSERREQLEMMIQWKEGICDLKDEAVERMAEYWSRLVRGWSLNELGRQGLRKLAGQYEVAELMDAMSTAVDQYVKLVDGKPTSESIEAAWKKVGGICRINQVAREKPYIRDLLYIRGILRNRIGLRGYDTMAMLEEAHLSGIPIVALRRVARECGSWTAFQEALGVPV